jgi:hypothetical protein
MADELAQSNLARQEAEVRASQLQQALAEHKDANAKMLEQINSLSD